MLEQCSNFGQCRLVIHHPERQEAEREINNKYISQCLDVTSAAESHCQKRLFWFPNDIFRIWVCCWFWHQYILQSLNSAMHDMGFLYSSVQLYGFLNSETQTMLIFLFIVYNDLTFLTTIKELLNILSFLRHSF